MHNLTAKTFGGFFWVLTGTGGQAFLQLVVLTILARLLTPEDFGVVTVAIVVVNFTTLTSELGIGPALVQRAVLEERHVRVGFGLTLLFGVAAFGLILAAAPAIAALFEMPPLAPVLRVIACLFLIRSVTVISEKLMQRDLAFRALARIQVWSYALGFGVIGVVAAAGGMGVWALVLAYVGQALVAGLLLLRARPFPMVPAMEIGAARDLLSYGGGITIARLLNQVALQGDNIVVGYWLGAAAVGLYGRAYQLMTMPASLFGTALDKVLFPVMSKVQHRRDLLATSYRRGVALIALLAMPATGVVLVLAPELVMVLLGAAWMEIVLPLRILGIGLLFRTSYKMSDSLARSTGAVYRRAWRQGVYAGCVLGGAWVGQHWGIVGVTVGVLGALAVNYALMAQLSLSLTGLSARDFVGVHVRALPVSVAATAGAIGAATLLRGVAAPSLVTLLVGCALAVALAVAVSRVGGRHVLGSDGTWLLQTLSGFVPPRYLRVVRAMLWARG